MRNSLLVGVALFGIVSSAQGADRTSVADYFQNDHLRPSISPSLGGFVVGGIGGHTWGEAKFTSPLLPDEDFTDDSNGWDGGVLVGYEFVSGGWFTGLEILGAFGGPEKDSDLGAGIAGSYGVDAHVDARIRTGFMATDRLAVFAIVGGTFARLEVEASDGVILYDTEDWQLGVIGGAGLEYLLTQHLSIAAEYTYTALEEESYFDVVMPDGSIDSLITADGSFHAVRGAVRFRF